MADKNLWTTLVKITCYIQLNHTTLNNSTRQEAFWTACSVVMLTRKCLAFQWDVMVYNEKIEVQQAKWWTATISGSTARKCKGEWNRSTGIIIGQSNKSNHKNSHLKPLIHYNISTERCTKAKYSFVVEIQIKTKHILEVFHAKKVEHH